MRPETIIEIEGVDGSWWTIAGPNAGDKGVWLGTKVTGLYEPPVKVVTEAPGNWPGERYLAHRVQKRDITFGVEILHEECDTWASRDSLWRKAWAFDRDARMHITTAQSGRRWIKLRLGESPEVDWETDPTMKTVNRTNMVVVALDPFWYQDDEVHVGVCQTDTTFDPNALQLPWPWPKKKLPTETIRITVPVANPTDQPIWPKWSCPGSTFEPAEPYVPALPWLGAPKSRATIWTIPDYSFKNDDKANRRITLPSLIGGLRTDEVQTVVVDGRPTGGTWTLSLGAETTTALKHDVAPRDLRLALEALAQVAAGDVDVAQLPAINEVQTIELEGGATGGTFTLTLEGQTTGPIPYNADAVTLYAKIAALPVVGLADAEVDVQFTQNCEQQIFLVGEPTAGTFTLTLDGHTTDPIPYNAGNFRVANALAKLPNIGPFAISVSGSPPFKGGGPWTVKFQNTLAGVNINPITGDAGGLSGGAGIAVSVKRTKVGGRRYRITFRNRLGGANVGQFVGNPLLLTGGKEPKVAVETLSEGSQPYQITFTKLLGGKNMPEMVGDATRLTGCPPGVTPDILVETITEGHTYPAENAWVDSDPRVEQVTSESGSQLWGRMNGVRMLHHIPPYTGQVVFEVTASGCLPGQSVAVHLPRPWLRPWGMH